MVCACANVLRDNGHIWVVCVTRSLPCLAWCFKKSETRPAVNIYVNPRVAPPRLLTLALDSPLMHSSPVHDYKSIALLFFFSPPPVYTLPPAPFSLPFPTLIFPLPPSLHVAHLRSEIGARTLRGKKERLAWVVRVVLPLRNIWRCGRAAPVCPVSGNSIETKKTLSPFCTVQIELVPLRTARARSPNTKRKHGPCHALHIKPIG